MINSATLIGRLGADPEVRFTADGSPVANCRIATDETYKTAQGEKIQKTEWHNVVMFGALATVASDYLKKGRLVYVDGRIQTRQYQDQNGINRSRTEIIVRNMKMMPDGSRFQATQEPAPAAPEIPVVDQPGCPF